MRAAILVLVLLVAGCGGSSSPPVAEKRQTCTPTPGGEESVAPASAGTPSRIRLGPGMALKATKRNVAAGRGGKPLVVTGLVRDEDCAPLGGATINAWQTNSRGRYGPLAGGQDRCCYLQGTVRTGADGRYTIDTVLPKGYDGGPAHIHMTAGHPDAEGLITELLFGAETSPDAVTVPLEDVRDGTADFDITLRGS
jgi:protocatechuate 3,4-dioxygenase beta subunit